MGCLGRSLIAPAPPADPSQPPASPDRRRALRLPLSRYAQARRACVQPPHQKAPRRERCCGWCNSRASPAWRPWSMPSPSRHASRAWRKPASLSFKPRCVLLHSGLASQLEQVACDAIRTAFHPSPAARWSARSLMRRRGASVIGWRMIGGVGVRA